MQTIQSAPEKPQGGKKLNALPPHDKIIVKCSGSPWAEGLFIMDTYSFRECIPTQLFYASIQVCIFAWIETSL